MSFWDEVSAPCSDKLYLQAIVVVFEMVEFCACSYLLVVLNRCARYDDLISKSRLVQDNLDKCIHNELQP